MNKIRVLALVVAIFILSCSSANKNVKEIDQGYIIPQMRDFKSYYTQYYNYNKYLEFLSLCNEEPFRTGEKDSKYRIHINFTEYHFFATFEKKDYGGSIRLYMPDFNFWNDDKECFYLSDYTYEMDKKEWKKFENEIENLGFWEFESYVAKSPNLVMAKQKREFLVEGIRNGKYMKKTASEYKYRFKEEILKNKDKPKELELPHFIIRLIIRNFYSKKAQVVEYPIAFQKKKHVKDILCKEKMFKDQKGWVY